MQNSEVEYKKQRANLWPPDLPVQRCYEAAGYIMYNWRQPNRLSVNLPVCPEFSPGTGREGVKNDGKSAHYEPLCEKCSTYMRASTNAAGGSGASHETSKFAALVPSLPMHRTESERAYILGPTRVRRKEDRPVLHATPLQRQHSRIANDSMNSRY